MAFQEQTDGRTRFQPIPDDVKKMLGMLTAKWMLEQIGGNGDTSDPSFQFFFQEDSGQEVFPLATIFYPLGFDVIVVGAYRDHLYGLEDTPMEGVFFILEVDEDGVEWIVSDRFYTFDNDELADMTTDWACRIYTGTITAL